MDDTARYIKSAHPIVYSHELVELLFTQPYCRVTDIVQHDIASRNTASRYLKELLTGEVLIQRKEGREILYINSKFLDLLKSDKHEFKPYPSANAPAPTEQTLPAVAPTAPRPSRPGRVTPRGRTSS